MIIGLLFNNLGRHVQRSAFERSEDFSFVAHRPRESKVTELDHSIAGHQNVLRLHISMGDSVRMNVMKGPDQLLGYFSDILHLQTLIVFDNIKKFTLTQLSDQYELTLCLERVQEQNDVLVLELFKNFNLLAHGFDIFFLLAFFLDRLYGHKLPCKFLAGFIHLTICALADERYNLIIFLFVLDRHPKPL